MQEKSNKKNGIIMGAIILVVIVAGYFYVTRDQSSSELLTGMSPSEAAPMDGDLIAALSSLRRLRLDDSIFKSPAWRSFSDFGQTLAPQPAGRPNPFAPFASTSAGL